LTPSSSVTYSLPKIPDNPSTTRYNHARALIENFDQVHLISQYNPPDKLKDRFESVRLVPEPNSVGSVLANLSTRVNTLNRLNRDNDIKLNLTTFHYLPAISGYISDLPWVVDMYDDPSQFAFNEGAHHHFGIKVLNFLLNSSDGGLITLHPNFSQNYKFEKIYLMNGSPSDRVIPPSNHEEGRFKSNKEDGISAVWLGKTGIKDGMRILIDSLNQVDVHVDVDVFGTPYERSKTYAEEKSVDDALHFHGYVPHDELVKNLYKWDVGLCILPRREDWLYSYPIKVGEYMSAGMVPVVSDFPGINRMVGSAGFKVDPIPEELSSTLEEISNLDSKEWQEMSKNSRDRAETIAWRGIREEMVVGLKQLLSTNLQK